MVPNFALDLSEDGIVLFHRLPDGTGWEIVAEVALDSGNLAAELKGLRKIAERLEGSDFATKLILPPSQLLYANVPVGHDVHGDVERALEARTPYAIDDLTYDIRGTSPEVQVVAVARETLREAEGFIEPYELNAVGFTASPDQSLFPGEPNLGKTSLGEMMGFETDLDPVIMPDTQDEADPEPAPAPKVEPTQADNDGAKAETSSAEQDGAEEAADTPAAEPEREPDPEPKTKEAEPAAQVKEQAKEAEVEAEEGSAPDAEEDNGKTAAEDPEPEDTTKEAAEPATEEPDIVSETEAEPDPTPEDAQEAETSNVGPAAFSSRRRGDDTGGSDAGARVTKLSARMSIPDKAPKLAGVKPSVISKQSAAKPVKVPPPLTAKDDRQQPPPVVPPARQKTSAPAARPKGLASALKGKLAAREAIREEAPTTTDTPALGGAAVLAAGEIGGKPRRLGLILTLILLAMLGLFAVLSSYLLPENSVSSLFGGEEVAESTDTAPDVSDEEAADLEIAALPPETFDQTAPGFALPADSDVTDADTTRLPAPAQMTLDDAETAYAVSGIWQKSPDLDNTISANVLDDLYIPSQDSAPDFEDAPALASLPAENDDVVLVNPVAPPPPDARFAFDERGLIRPSIQGALNPEGVLIFLGKPPVEAIPRPENLVPEEEPEVDDRLAGIRPAPRPDNLIETQERATLGGRSRDELAAIRPIQRPQSAQAQAEAIARAVAEAEAESTEAEAEAEEVDPLAGATQFAVARSATPDARPRNFNRIVNAARTAQARAAQRRTEQNNSPAAQTASASTASPSRGSGPAVARASRTNPTGPTRASVARAATDNNALALGRVSLIGVFGTSSNRRALVRMPNGRFKKVGIGDRIDGGRVAAIGSGQLRYTKGGRTVTLKMPQG